MSLAIVDMRPLNAETLSSAKSKAVPARFAFYDCSRAKFVMLITNQAWETWEDFERDYSHSFGPKSVLRAPYALGSFRRACPKWVFEVAG